MFLDDIGYWAARSDLMQGLREIPLWLQKKSSYSQHGEDRFLLERIFTGRQTPGTYVDIGASHPVRISNTYLLYRMGWSGVVVEPISRLVRLQKKWRPRDTQVQCVIGETDGQTIFYSMYPSVLSTASPEQYHSLLDRGYRLIEKLDIPQFTIDTIFRNYLTGNRIDFMSVDVEGMDWVVARQIAALDDRLLPQCLCIECNDTEAEARVRAWLDPKYEYAQRLGANLIFWEARR